ncbi:hypothetical protein [Companilactobacillus sp. HBUAS59544]|jgi:virulence-associated protein VagC|uniref:hypothetical protein n=1 Tax=Companilactobacillus sp. HBUAS59544 TaxID=3109363 RepID=UPI002FF35CE6
MSKEVRLRKSGNSLILTVPSGVKDKVGAKYSVSTKEDGTIIYKPVKHVNVFSTKKFMEHDFHKDMEEIPETMELRPVGREKLQ